MADVLVDDARHRQRRLAAVGGALLLGLVVGGAVLRSTLPPPPLELRLVGVSGTALRGESFIRLHLTVEQSGARDVEDAVLTLAGTTQRGSHPTVLEDERLTVQVDLTPPCSSLSQELAAGALDLRLHDVSGDARDVRLPVPADAQVERLLRYRCTEQRRP